MSQPLWLLLILVGFISGVMYHVLQLDWGVKVKFAFRRWRIQRILKEIDKIVKGDKNVEGSR